MFFFFFHDKIEGVSMRARQSFKLIISTCALTRTYVNIVYIAGGKIYISVDASTTPFHVKYVQHLQCLNTCSVIRF